jgi:hypothetical protein
MAVPVSFDQTSSGYSLRRAYWLARAAGLAREDRATVEAQAARWGFDRVRHHESRFTPPFPLDAVRACTLASDRVIVTAFGGTEPTRIRDWLTDPGTPLKPGPGGNGYVHQGFAEALEPLYPDVQRALDGLRTHLMPSYLAALEKNLG